MTPNVSLPMYNLPEMRADNSRFWEALRELLVEAGLRDRGPLSNRSSNLAGLVRASTSILIMAPSTS